MGATGGSTLTNRQGEAQRVELLGELDRSLDDRGRLSMPTAFRPAFGDGAVILAWPGPCVAILPLEEFRSIEDDMRAKEREQLTDSLPRQALNSLSTHTHLDAAGRLFVPESLREHASIGRELVVVGQRRRLELWTRSARDEGAQERWQALVAHISTEAV